MLDRSADAAAARPAEAAPGRAHEPERGAQAAPARVGKREHRLAGADVGDDRRVPGDRGRAAGVDLDHGDVDICILPRDPAVRDLAVGPPDGHLVAAQDVRIGEHTAVGDDHAGAASPAAPEPDDGRPDPLFDGGHRGLQLIQERHCASSFRILVPPAGPVALPG